MEYGMLTVFNCAKIRYLEAPRAPDQVPRPLGGGGGSDGGEGGRVDISHKHCRIGVPQHFRDPRECTGDVAFPPTFRLHESRVEAANSNFVPFPLLNKPLMHIVMLVVLLCSKPWRLH